MLLIVGLGNPGEKYQRTRHNAGFIVLDELKSIWNFPEFKSNKKFNSEVSEGTRNETKVMLAKPQTFMNKSGEAARSILDFYKITPENIIVIHDDLDILIGSYKISDNSTAAGHKGAQSLMDHLGTQEFKRVRIGVELEEGREARKIPGEDFVLQDLSDEEYGKVKNLAKDIIKAI